MTRPISDSESLSEEPISFHPIDTSTEEDDSTE